MIKHIGRTKKSKGAVLILVLLLFVAGLYFFTHREPSPNLATTSSNRPVKGTVSQPTTHELPNNATGRQIGGVTDKNGRASVSLPPSSQWVSSNSGKVTLQQPSPNSLLKSGDSLIGLAKLDG